MVYRRLAGQFFRYLWLTFALLVIVYAVVVATARELLPVLNHYQTQINDYLSETTGMDFEIRSLEGRWRGASPMLALEDISIVSRDGKSSAVAVDHLAAEINLIKSAANRSLVWQALTAGHIQIELIEDEDGRWTLGGHPLGLGSGNTDLEYLFRMLYYSRLLRIDELVVDLHFYAGSEAQFYARDLQVENNDGFHRAVASIALARRGKNIAKFVFEGTGDPANPEEFTGQGYLHLSRLNMEGSLKTLVDAWVPQLVEKLEDVETDLDLAFWFDWDNNALVNGRGRLKAVEIPLPLLPDSPPLTDVEAEVTAWLSPGESWGFRVQDFNAILGDRSVEPLDIQISQGVGSNWGELNITANHIDLAMASGTLLNAGILGETGDSVLSSLNPRGVVRQATVAIDFSGAASAAVFKVQANLDNVAVDSWKGSPSARGVSGYLESTLEEGFVIVDSPDGFAMHYPQAYADFMPYGSTRGKVGWRWLRDSQRVLVTSNQVEVDGDEGQGKVFLHLDLPTEPDGDPEMYLMVGMKNSHTRFVERYLPAVLSNQLQDWLDRAIGEGDITEAGFIWRGSLKKEEQEGRAIQVFAKLRNGDIKFQDDWPAAQNVNATLVVNNLEMDTWVDSGNIANETFENLGVNIRQRRSGPLLRVVGNVRTSVENSFSLLAQSPLQQQLRGVTQLNASGDVDVNLDLHIPLSANEQTADYRVVADLKNATLMIPGSEYQIENIHGPIHYSQASGLSSKQLTAAIWGEPLTVSIVSDEDNIHIDGSSVIAETGLKTLLGEMSERVQGQTPVTADVRIPLQNTSSPVVLTLNSNLEGLQVMLPAPFAKHSEDGLMTQATLEIGDRIHVRGGVENTLGFNGLFDDGAIIRGTVNLLADAAALPARDQILVSGHLPKVDWSEWEPVLTGQSGTTLSASLPRGLALDLTIDELIVKNYSLDRTSLQGGYHKGDGWRFQVQSPRIAGDVAISTPSAPLQLTLDYLKIPALEESTDTLADDVRVEESHVKNTGDDTAENDKASDEQPRAGLMDTLTPDQIPEFDLVVEQLFYKDKPLGSIKFNSRRLDQGIVFTDIEGLIQNIGIKPQILSEEGEDEEVDPAQLQWMTTENGTNTFFSGTLRIENIEEVLSQWDFPAPFSAEKSAFYLNLGWEGKPWEVETLELDGYLGIDLENGQFKKATGSAANALFKLVGLINFDTWLRRLRFDFSDFFSDGLSFDQVQGGLLFRKGIVDFEDPVIATMPSGTIRLLGEADLIYEQLDTRLVATMPIGTNLPWVAGLLGGLPGAAGVFLISKLFEKQVDQLSSISYKITGPFDDPEIDVERIFTDPTKVATQPTSQAAPKEAIKQEENDGE